MHPLTGKTFRGTKGELLGKEMLAAKKAGFPIVMLHENDPAKHGCEFSVFFDGRTPSELLESGIYTALALALYPGEFHTVSVALAALALGATRGSPWARLKARLLDKREGPVAQRSHIIRPQAQDLSARTLLKAQSGKQSARPLLSHCPKLATAEPTTTSRDGHSPSSDPAGAGAHR